MGSEMNEQKLQELLWTFAQHRVLTVAARTGILRELDPGPRDVDQLATDLSLDRLATGKMVRSLCAMGVVRAEGEQYVIGESLEGLFRPGPEDFANFMEHSHSMYERWGASLEKWLRGEPWKTQGRDAEGVARFGAAMRAMASRISKTLAKVLDLDGVNTMLDVGGGTGAYSMSLCGAREGLKATVLDIPEVAEIGRAQTAGTPMVGSLEFRGGDYMDKAAYEGRFDLVLLANVLHQETVERASRMVELAAGAVGPGGRVVVLDFAIDDGQKENVLGSLFAINMRSFGDTHPEPTIRGWLETAGLVGFERLDLDGARWVLSARKS